MALSLSLLLLLNISPPSYLLLAMVLELGLAAIIASNNDGEITLAVAITAGGQSNKRKNPQINYKQESLIVPKPGSLLALNGGKKPEKERRVRL